MTRPAWSEPLGMLLLRLGCAWFIFVWAVNKYFAPGQYAFILKRFDGIEAGFTEVYVLATLQVVICIAVFVGYQRTFSYAALALLHALTVYRVWPQLIDPFLISDKGFPKNRNSVNALAIFLAMLALWLLRGRDRWSLDAWLARRRGDG